MGGKSFPKIIKLNRRSYELHEHTNEWLNRNTCIQVIESILWEFKENYHLNVQFNCINDSRLNTFLLRIFLSKTQFEVENTQCHSFNMELLFPQLKFYLFHKSLCKINELCIYLFFPCFFCSEKMKVIHIENSYHSCQCLHFVFLFFHCLWEQLFF